MMDKKEYLTVTEAAHLIGVSRTLIYRAIASGLIHPVQSPLYKRGGLKLPRAEVAALAPKPRP